MFLVLLLAWLFSSVSDNFCFFFLFSSEQTSVRDGQLTRVLNHHIFFCFVFISFLIFFFCCCYLNFFFFFPALFLIFFVRFFFTVVFACGKRSYSSSSTNLLSQVMPSFSVFSSLICYLNALYRMALFARCAALFFFSSVNSTWDVACAIEWTDESWVQTLSVWFLSFSYLFFFLCQCKKRVFFFRLWQ